MYHKEILVGSVYAVVQHLIWGPDLMQCSVLNVSFCQKCSAAHYSGNDPNVDKRHARRAFDGPHHCCNVFPVLLGQAILCLRVAVKHDMNSLLILGYLLQQCAQFSTGTECYGTR